MLITVQPDPNWQLSLAQLSPSLSDITVDRFQPQPQPKPQPQIQPQPQLI